jgi:DUF4097 and DUF4098 domain-containing protein YvlB
MILLTLVAVSAFGFGGTEPENAEYSGVLEIQVDAGTFDVSVQGTRGRKTSIEVRNESDDYRVRHSQSSEKLEVWVERRFSVFGRPHNGRITILAPVDTLVRVRASTGDVEVQNFNAERMSVDTSTGDVRITDVTAVIDVETSTGEIEIEDCAGRFTIRSSTGDIGVYETTGNLSAQSSTGGHRYENLIGDLNARSTTGRIEIDGLQGRLDIRTSTGSQEGRAIVLTGDSSFESSTGRIDMDFNNAIENLEFDLRSTTGSLRVGREESQRQLFLGATGFTISGRSSTGSQEYR